MKYCNKCVTPETAETNIFGKDGVCSVCNQIDTKSKINWEERSKDLDNIIKDYKDKFEYDCIIPFSGGKDSTFALWYLIRKKKLRPLVVRFDHNFLRKNLQENTEKTLNKLGADFINFKPNFEVVKKLMFESLFRRGDFCWHCHVGITAFPINTAIKKNIPLLFYGEPSAEYGSFYTYNEMEELNVEKFNRSVNLGINAEDMLEMLKERYPKEEFKKEIIEPYIFPTQREIIKNNIKAIYLGNYIAWDVKKQVEIIKSELDWKGDEVEGIPENYDYEKIECMMQGVRDYIKYLKRGFGRTSHLTSIDIRNGRLKRGEAKELVQIYDGKKPKSLELFLKLINISEDEFYKIVKTHVVSPFKWPSKDTLKKNTSNQIPHDYEEWVSKFK